MTWRFLATPAFDGATNMAVDVVLMERARRTGESVLRVYEWARPTLSLGRNQLAAGRYDLAELTRRGIDVVRRPTGGRAILHWHELTYSVTAPAAGTSLSDEYARINAVLVRALWSLGADAVLVETGSARGRAPDMHPCFAEPSAGEIVLGAIARGKLVGSAQFRENGALLQHGSILIRDDQSLLRELAREPLPASQAAALSDALRREVAPAEVAAALFGAARAHLDPDITEVCYSEIEDEAAVAAGVFRDSLWTWRR